MRHTNEMCQTDRNSFYEIFRKFREGYDESQGDYSNRDELLFKLLNDGELTKLDIHMLKVAVANEVQEKPLYDYFMDVLK